MLRLPLLLLCLSLLGEAFFPDNMYVFRISEHAETPIKSYRPVSQVQCAVQCARSTACINFSWNSSTALCQLWPKASDSNPLTSSQETIYWHLPEEFTPFDRTVAFGYSAKSSGGIDSIISRCREMDPTAFPTVPQTDDEFQHIYRFSVYGFVGLTDQTTENTFVNMTSGEVVTVPDSWWYAGSPGFGNALVHNCVHVHKHGKPQLVSVNCAALHNVICEIRK